MPIKNLPLYLAREAAKKIVFNPEVAYAGGAKWSKIPHYILSDEPLLVDDNKKWFIDDNVDRPLTDDGKAYNWNNEIKENHYKNVKSYEGILNPYNEYVLPTYYEPIVKELANQGAQGHSNINMEYSDPVTERRMESVPMFDDVHGYALVFHNDRNGNPVISASDLYDFDSKYEDRFERIFNERTGSKNSKNTLKLQRKMLNAVGQPYKLVQHNIPIRFSDELTPEEEIRANGFTDNVLNIPPAIMVDSNQNEPEQNTQWNVAPLWTTR